MSNRITPRDVEIVRHVEKYGFITIKQASRIWFRTKKDSYNLAQRRLSACVKCEQLKVNIQRFKQDDCNIYYLKEDYSRVSRHTMKIMDIFIELQLMGAKVLYFKREENWLKGRYRSDAFAVISMESYVYPIFIEVLDGSIKTKKYEKEVDYLVLKYRNIIDSLEPIDKVNSFLEKPLFSEEDRYSFKVLIVDEKSSDDIKTVWKHEMIEFRHVDFDLYGIAKVLV